MKTLKVAFVIFNSMDRIYERFWGDIRLNIYSGLFKKLGIKNDILLVLLYAGKKKKNIHTISRFIDHCRARYDFIFLRAKWSSIISDKIEKELGSKVYYVFSQRGKKKLESLSERKTKYFNKGFYPSFDYKFFGFKNPLDQKMSSFNLNVGCSYIRGVEDNYYYKSLGWANKGRWKGCSYCASALRQRDISQSDKLKQLRKQFLYLSKELPSLELVALPFPENYFDVLGELVAMKDLRPVGFHVQLRPDVLVNERERIAQILKLMKRTRFSFFISNIGFENFSKKELGILNRGYNFKVNIEALKIFWFFKNKYPDTWITKETAASFIMFEPFTSVEDILINLNHMLKLKEYLGLFGTLNLNKLRFNKDTPIYFLAKKAGLINNRRSTDILSNLSPQGYSIDAAEYRFQSSEVSSVYKLYHKLLFSNEASVANFNSIYCISKSLKTILGT